MKLTMATVIQGPGTPNIVLDDTVGDRASLQTICFSETPAKRSLNTSKPSKPAVIVTLVLVGIAVAGTTWWLVRRRPHRQDLVLYGNVDLRQVELAFNNNERIAAVLVQEGDRVKRGQILAHLNTNRLEPQVAQAEALAAAQREAVARLHNGSRPQEIAEAQANVESAKADAINARGQYERRKTLAANSIVSRQDLENAKAALDVANAKLAVNQKTLDLAIAGPRKEDIGQAEAELRADEAQAAFLRQELADAQLVAPVDAVIRTRLMEPGEMASPQRPVFSLAVTDPKWVRAYVAEPDVGRLKTGMSASVALDSFPNRRFNGWVGFISPVAEFTPKSVETTELRTSLVYEVRVFVKDPSDQLHLGSPASVYLLTDGGKPPYSSGLATIARVQQ
jgi:HlyD family secretion protein